MHVFSAEFATTGYSRRSHTSSESSSESLQVSLQVSSSESAVKAGIQLLYRCQTPGMIPRGITQGWENT